MPKITVEVEMMDTGRVFPVVIRSMDFRTWEAATDQSWFAVTTSVTNITELAYYAAVRLGEFDGTLAEWSAVADIDEETDDSEGPTPPTGGESPSSG
jgi:hypothetical protein